DAMVAVNGDGEIVLVNVQAETQFGFPRDELLGQKVNVIIKDGLGAAQILGSGIELTGRRKNGSEFPVEIRLSTLETDAGILMTAAIRDISVRKAAEKHLA